MNVRDQRGSEEQRPARGSWLAGLGATVAVLLIIGISIALFARRDITGSPTSQPGSSITPPPGGQWVNVENHYLFSSLEAAPANPALLYACASPYPMAQGASPRYTLLRSSDFGAHWQDLGKQAALRDFCQVTINPANANELYMVTAGTSSGNFTPDVLKHSTDGGETWTTLQPKVDVGMPITAAWHVQKLRMVGNDLFGIQQMSQIDYGSTRLFAAPARSHLVQSSDSGKTWTVIDNAHVSTGQMVYDYAVDPAQSQTIYEIVGPLPRLGPPGAVDQAEGNATRSTARLTLYKTTDGGKNWQALLNDLLTGSTLQLASAQPSTLYIGETTTVKPLNSSSVAMAQVQSTGSGPLSIRIRASIDGGATWRNALQVTGGTSYVHGWFSGANGRLYALVGGVGNTNVVLQQYDPSGNRWSDVSKLPQAGELLAATNSGAGNGAVLWLRSFTDGKTALYRYVTA